MVSQNGFIVAGAPPDRLFLGTAITGCDIEAARADVTFLHGVLQVVLISLFSAYRYNGIPPPILSKNGFRQLLVCHPLHMACPPQGPLRHYTMDGTAVTS